MFAAYIGIMQNIAEIESDVRFRESIKDLPIDKRIEMQNAHYEIKEEDRKEATIERRHREKCAAIVEAGRLAGRSYY